MESNIQKLPQTKWIAKTARLMGYRVESYRGIIFILSPEGVTVASSRSRWSLGLGHSLVAAHMKKPYGVEFYEED